MNIFKDKTCIVTGAASGIGKALSEELARRGARVVVADLSEDKIREVVGNISAAGGMASGAAVDVTDFEAVKKVVDDAVSENGRLDYIFNNAGIVVGGEAHLVPVEDWRKVIEVNLMGVVHGVAAAYPVMVRQGSGHIINTASVDGLAPLPMMGSYTASKFGVVGLSGSLRVEGKDLGVKVSVVCPGIIRTPILETSKVVNMESVDMQSVPDWISMTAEECAQVVLRGVERNRPIILVTFLARFISFMQRLSPGLVRWFMGLQLRKMRQG